MGGSQTRPYDPMPTLKHPAGKGKQGREVHAEEDGGYGQEDQHGDAERAGSKGRRP